MTPLCRKEDSALLCIDIQERLLGAMVEPARSRMLDNVEHLLKTSTLLDIPVFYTEQYPAGLGATDARIKSALPPTAAYFDKTSFSCCGEDKFLETLRQSHKRQVVVTGMETHICVMQTALELQHDGFQVFVVDDAVCSQRMAHWKSALHRLRHAGVVVAPTESVLFEWLRNSSDKHFKAVSALLR